MGNMGGGMTGWMWMPGAVPTFAAVMAIHLQPIPVLPAIAALLGLLYAAAVVRLRLRGDRWPRARSIWWAVGVLSMLAVTATAMDGYGMELFSIHMIQHMVLGMITPIFFVLGAPITLVLRSLPARSRARRMLLGTLHSLPARLLTNPVLVSAIFFVSLYGLYFTPLFDTLMHTMWGHNVMLLHFIAVGFLYFWGILQVDPSPPRSTKALGGFGQSIIPLLSMGGGVPFHAFFGVALMLSPTLLTVIYAHPPASWDVSPLGDQQGAGGIAWGFTELPTLLVLGLLLVQWDRSDARALARSRRGNGREEAELAAYNAHLARLAARD